MSPGSGTAREADVTGKFQMAFLSDWMKADFPALVETPVATSAAASAGRMPEDEAKVTGTLLPVASVFTGSHRLVGSVRRDANSGSGGSRHVRTRNRLRVG